MKNLVKNFCTALSFSVLLLCGTAEAAENRTTDYFGEFRVPLQIVSNSMYQRNQFIHFAEYVAYNSPFNILPNEIELLVRHEYPILASYMCRMGVLVP